MLEMFQFEFMQNAFLAAVLASLACGVIGVFVVVKRIVSISGGIAHASFGGVGLGYLLGINPVYTLIPFSILSAISIGLLTKKTKMSEDTSIGIFWSLGMALGILFIGLAATPAPDLFSYLFGNILIVPRSDIYLMIALNVVIYATIFSLYKYFIAVSFDEEYVRSQGIKTNIIYILLLCLISLTIVTLIRIVGIILVISLLTIPAIISKQFIVRLKPMMLLSVIIGILVTTTGLVLSYHFDLVSGPTIIILATVVYLMSLGLKKMFSYSSKLT
jgi:zinc transport system permease protein